MVKIIIAFLIVLVAHSSADNTLILSGFSKHLNTNEKFNEVNTGIGYRYSRGTSSFTILALRDSYSNMMYTATYGKNYYLLSEKDLSLSIGAEFGATIRKINYETHFKYGALPVAFVPQSTLEYKGYSVTLVYVPEMKIKSLVIREVIYCYFGIKF